MAFTRLPSSKWKLFGGLNTSSTNNSPINFSGLTKKLTAQTTVVAEKIPYQIGNDQGGNITTQQYSSKPVVLNLK
jgi:hypothetical protein